MLKEKHKKRKARELALQLLYKWEYNGSDGLFDLSWVDENLPVESKRYAKEIVRGVVENVEELDSLIKAHSENWDFDRISIIDKNIMRIAIYEMMKGEVPPKVAIDEAVEIAKEFSGKKSHEFVNGILDAIKNHLGL